MKTTYLLAATAAAALTAFPAAAQDHDHGAHSTAPAPAPTPSPTPTPDHAQHKDHMGHAPDASAEPTPAAPEHEGHEMTMSGGSGTARVPVADGGMPGVHFNAGSWMLMAHGYAWASYTDQGGPRGDDMAFVQSMAMLMGEREVSDGVRLQLRTMMSLEPAMNARGYPNLLATGETASGESLVDRQHPHDLFMELAGRLDFDIGEDQSIFLYGGPVGEPALGPSAFMHRGSARYMPLAPITHHWFDSTHITYGVVTLGYAGPKWQLEASAFRGREPDERRWNIETPKLDSWSVRASYAPSDKWLLQVSHGRLKEPERLHGNEDEGRTTASVQYGDGRLSAMLAFSAKDRIPGRTLTAWLAEAGWNPAGGHNLFGRIENVANDELFPDHGHPLHDRAFRVTRFEAGYAHRFRLAGPLSVAVGGSTLALVTPDALDPYYGKSSLGWTGFVKLTLDGS